MIKTEEEKNAEKLKQLEKQRLKEEKKKIAQKEAEEKKYNFRKELLKKEMECYESVKDQIIQTTNFTADIIKYSILNTQKQHFWGTTKLKNEWKDFHTRQLLEDVKGRMAGENYMSQVYLESFEHIMGSFQEIMLQMMSDFEFQRDRMLKNHSAFMKYAKLKGMEVRDDVRTVSYATSDRYERKCKFLMRRQRKYRLKLHNKHLNKIAETAYDLETKAFNIWVQFRTVFGRFRKDWKVARRLIFFLKLQDVEDRKQIGEQKKLLDNMKNVKTINTGTYEKCFWNEKNKELAAERTDYANGFGLLQHILKENQKYDESKLSHLSKVSFALMKELETIKDKVERVLKVKQLCFKLETEEEKVFPTEYVELCIPMIRKEFDGALCLDKLTYRTAIVKNHCAHMENQLEKLVKTNEDLKNKLRFVLHQLRPNRDIDLVMQHY